MLSKTYLCTFCVREMVFLFSVWIDLDQLLPVENQLFQPHLLSVCNRIQIMKLFVRY